MFPKYPYLDLSDRNLDFLTKAIREMENEVKNFVSLNAVKYANPIQWSINRQYEKNTIVIDPLTGTAFISVQPVPRGVALTRTQYWTVVFDLSQFVTKAASNFANTYERDITTTATMSTGAGDWVVWDSTLYVALTSIHAGDTYVVNGNIKRMTVEDFYDLLMQAIHSLDEELDTEIRNRTDADTTLQGNIDAEARARGEADTTLQSNIDAEARARSEADTTLQSNIDAEARARSEADTNITTRINNANVKNAKDYGAVGDGVTDDTISLQSWLDDLESGDVGYLPSGKYLATATLTVPNVSDISIYGTNTSEIIANFTSGDILVCGGATRKRNITIDGIRINSNVLKTSGAALHVLGYVNKSTFKNVYLGDYGSGNTNLYDGIIFEHTNVTVLDTFSINAVHDGVLIHGGVGNVDPDSSDLFMSNGFVIGCNSNVHVAGGFGGLYINNTLLFGGTNGLVVDNSICTQGNREIMLSNTVCIDGCDGALILINETVGSGAFINTNAFLSGAGYYASPDLQPYASNIKVQSFPYGTLNVANCTIKGCTANAIWINDTTAKVFISESCEIAYNDVGVNNFNNSNYVYCHGILHDNTSHNFYGTYSPSIVPYT